MKHILHIVNDEKFIVDTNELFNKVPNYQHSYAVIGKKKSLQNLKPLDVNFINAISDSDFT